MTDWMAASTRTGRLMHAARQVRGAGWITYCGHAVSRPQYGAWHLLDEDILCCSTCYEGTRA